MSPRKLLLLTVVVLALFGFIFLIERRMPSTSERQERGDLVWDVPEDRLSEIQLERSGAVVQLKKNGGAWRLIKPESYPADASVVSDLVAQLARLKRASSDSAEARPEDYGLKSPSARATLVEGEGAKRVTHTVEFGLDIPGTDSTAARVTGHDALVFVPASAAGAARKGADDFKSKEVFGASLDLAKLDVERGRGRLSFARRDAIWWLDQPFVDLADADAVQRLISELTGLRVLEFVPAADRQNLAAYGLAPPLYRVVLTDPKGAAAAVDIGATRSDGNSVYARRENQVFTVSSTTVEDLAKEAIGFREPRLMRFERSSVTQVDASLPRGTFAIARSDAGWSAAGRPLSAASVDDVLTALLDLKSRSFLDAPEAAGTRSGQPAAEVTVRLSTGGPWTLKLFRRGADTEATVGGRPGAFLVSGDSVPPLESAFQKAMASSAPTPAAAPKANATKKP